MEYVIIGRIVNTHGIKGELKVKASTDFIEERLKKGQHVYIDDHGQLIAMKVQGYRFHKEHVLVSFQDHLDINMVEKYKGCLIYADKDINLLDEGEYYIGDLIGCQVYNYGELIGTVRDVQLYDHHDVLVVVGKQRILIPYVEAFVKKEDIDHKCIDVELIEGFYNEN